MLAFLIVIAALTLLAVFGGLVYVLSQVVKMQGKQLDASEKRDQRIDTVSTKVETVVQGQDKGNQLIQTNTKAFDKLAESVDANTELTRSTIKSYQTLEDNFVASYDSTSKVIGMTGLDIKKNADENTEKIIIRLDNVHTDVNLVPGKVIEGIDWDIVVQRVVDKLMPRVFEAVKEGLDDCINIVAAQAKDLDHANKVNDVLVKPPPTEPDPPPSPDHKAAIPFEAADTPDLSRTENVA